jgi:CTP synthase
VPLTLEDTGIADVICEKLKLDVSKPNLDPWREMVDRSMKDYGRKVTVGVVAKYMDNIDTYFCVFEALRSASWWNDTNIEIKWIDAEGLEGKEDISEDLAGVDGIVVPGGFGTRGLEGKIRAAQYSLKSKLPYLGLCLGLQMGVIAAARNGGIADATTAEMDAEAKNKLIHTMADQKGLENTGGTMRLGDYPCEIVKDSLAAKVYGSNNIVERHRHRYECNNAYRDQYESWGIRAVGLSPDGNLVEMIEGIDHPFFMASQFHPEFKSRPNRAHPMFDGFIASLLQKHS